MLQNLLSAFLSHQGLLKTLQNLLNAFLLLKGFPNTSPSIAPHTLVWEILTWQTRRVSHSGLAIYIKKYCKAKEELWKLKYFTMQKYNPQKILHKKPKSFKIL
jgi:hypothetical protein